MCNRARLLGISLLLPVVAFAAQTTNPLAKPAAVTQQRLLKGTDDPTQWATYGGSFSEQRFSPLKQINDQNVKNLGLTWFADYDTNLNMHGTPLYSDGVIYVSTSRNVVHAFDARDGKRLWTYTPIQIPHSNLGMANRGIAMWNGKIYMGTLDSRLIALDAKNGKLVWETEVTPRSLVGDMYEKYSISQTPRIAKGKVFIGASGGEYGARGFMAAFDAETGKEVWRFWTVPGDPAKGPDQKHLEVARKTWPTDIEYWKRGGGGTVWDATVYDPVTNLLYFGTGNGTPLNREMRDPGNGDNLYIASVIAVNADTGEYVWHYQETPGDTWDYDAGSPMMTADITIDGKKMHVIIHPSKNGFLYVIEAKTGKLISGDAFTSVTWATGVDLKTGRPIEVPGARFETEGFNVGPGAPGGHTWHVNAYSPLTGLVYIPTWENYSAMGPQKVPASGIVPLISTGGAVNRATMKPHNKTADNGWLQAWDPVARKAVWETPKGPRATSGAMATAGNLVFMGNSGGEQISAYNAKNGDKLWTYEAQTAVLAAPITYQLDGVQYIAASVGGVAKGGDYFAPSYGRMLVFKVGGKVKLPPNKPYTPRALDPPPATATADVVAHGATVYAENCAVCHGANAAQQRGSSAPMLTTTPLLYVQQGFDQVVLNGRLDRGMPSFGGKVAPADTAAVLAYVVSRANELKSAPPPAAPR